MAENNKTEDGAEDQRANKTIALNFHVSDKLATYYANEVAVQTIHTEFVFSFFEFRVPIGPPNTPPDSISANCVARVAISAEKVPDVIKALQNQFDRFVREREQVEKEVKKEAL